MLEPSLGIGIKNKFKDLTHEHADNHYKVDFLLQTTVHNQEKQILSLATITSTAIGSLLFYIFIILIVFAVLTFICISFSSIWWARLICFVLLLLILLLFEFVLGIFQGLLILSVCLNLQYTKEEHDESVD